MRWVNAVIAVVMFLVYLDASAWDPIRDLTGKRLDQHIDRGIKDLRNAPRSWGECAGNLPKCAEKEIKRIPYRALQPVLSRYKSHLFNQADGRFYKLPNWVINSVDSQYSIKLDRIRFATNINTIHGSAITWENSIFFPRNINLANPNDLHWLLHEIEHSVQYKNKGGFSGFFGEYLAHATGKIIKYGSFNVHDNISVERAADRKADFLMRNFFQGPSQSHRQPHQRRMNSYAQFCVFNGGSCRMMTPVRVGSRCYCQSFAGPIWGVAR